MKKNWERLNSNISIVKVDLENNSGLIEEENKKLQPLRDKKIENLSKTSKNKPRNYKSLKDKEKRVKECSNKTLNNL